MRRILAGWAGLVRVVAMLAAVPPVGIVDGSDGLGSPVSLALEGVSAKRSGEKSDVFFECKVIIRNDTGTALSVRSHFYSIYDGLDLVVFDESGAKLIQQPYIWHQSPYSAQARPFPVARGAHRSTLVIPVSGLKPDLRKVKVQVVGVLPGCDRAGVLVSGLVDVAIVPWASKGSPPAAFEELGPTEESPARTATVRRSASHRRS